MKGAAVLWPFMLDIQICLVLDLVLSMNRDSHAKPYIRIMVDFVYGRNP